MDHGDMPLQPKSHGGVVLVNLFYQDIVFDQMLISGKNKWTTTWMEILMTDTNIFLDFVPT